MTGEVRGQAVGNIGGSEETIYIVISVGNTGFTLYADAARLVTLPYWRPRRGRSPESMWVCPWVSTIPFFQNYPDEVPESGPSGTKQENNVHRYKKDIKIRTYDHLHKY